ncbi:MAG: hypothetical protein HY913_11320 [Desulfomonile tiedjei]|nr:hypothetical protein [Desulfomonile tiedjei]
MMGKIGLLNRVRFAMESMITYRPMSRTRVIALAVGGIVTLAVFVLAMVALIFGGFFSEREMLFYVSLALAPVAMVSVMVGYAVWWLVVFLLTLFLPNRSPDDTP